MKKTNTIQKVVLGISLSILAGLSSAQSAKADEAEVDLSKCPVLMVLERTTNTNRVWYQNTAVPTAPIGAKWEMREEGPNKWEGLTGMEKKKAYGIKLKSNMPEAKFTLAATDKVVFTLKKDERSGCPFVSYAQKNGPEMNVRKIKLIMKKSWIPSAEKIQFSGISLNDGRQIQAEVKL